MNREEKNEITKQRILTAAIQEFSQNDYSLASTNSICKNHNISKGLLFHHYKTKDEIFISCVDKCIQELVLYINNNYLPNQKDLKINLEKYFLVRHEFFQIHPHYSQILNYANINPPKHLTSAIDNLKQPLKELNTNILKNLLNNQKLKEGTTQEEIINLILNFSDYLVAKQYKSMDSASAHHIVAFINMLFYGVIDSKEV